MFRFEYVLAREYNWNVKNKASRGYEENYFFVMKEDGVYYNELETRLVENDCLWKTIICNNYNESVAEFCLNWVVG